MRSFVERLNNAKLREQQAYRSARRWTERKRVAALAIYLQTWLVKHLEHTGLTQKQVADELGIRESTMSKFLSGYGYPALVQQIADYKDAVGQSYLNFGD